MQVKENIKSPISKQCMLGVVTGGNPHLYGWQYIRSSIIIKIEIIFLKCKRDIYFLLALYNHIYIAI